MPDTGWKLPSQVIQQSDGSFAWTNPNNALTSDGQYAFTTPNASNLSRTLYFYGFDLTGIVAGSTVTSIDVRARASSSGGTSAPLQANLHVNSADSVTYEIGNPLSTSVTTEVDEAPPNWGNDAWLSLSRVQEAAFGVYLRADGGSGGGQFLVDYIELRIVYDLPRTDAVGALPNVTATPPAATVVGKANVSGSMPGASATPPEATVAGGANAAGPVPGVSATPPLAPTSAAADGALPSATASPPQATVSAAANVSGDLPAISATPPEGTAKNRLITPVDRIITVAGNLITDRTITVATNRVADRTINAS